MPALAMEAKLAAVALRERLSRAERAPRRPEPMIMDDSEAVAAFHVADPLLQLPVYRLNQLAVSALLPRDGSLLDLGSGTGQLLAGLAEARPDLSIVGTDLAETMLETGRDALRARGLDGRVQLRHADMIEAPAELGAGADAISCVWALHHLPTEQHVVRCLRAIAAARAATGCAVWIFDFARLRRPATMPGLISLSPDAPARLREDGVASERAAWSADELRRMLQESGLGDLRGGPERLIGHFQAYFAPAGDGRPSGHAACWSAPPLPVASERLFKRIRAGMPALPSP